MPRVSDAYRRARRDEIAEAALRVLRRNGVSATSIAQIVDESGLSAGAIYANFRNKAELARYIAERLFDWRIHRIEETGAPGAVRSPVELMRVLMTTAEEDAPPIEVLLQFWAESTRDPDLHAVLAGKMASLREAFAEAVLPWARNQVSDSAEDLATRTAVTMVVLCQGLVTNRGLLGWIDADEFLADAERLFTAG